MGSLQEERVRRLLSVRALAERAGVAPNTVHLVETGQRLPQLLTAQKLSVALGVEPNEVDEFRAAIEASLAGKDAA